MSHKTNGDQGARQPRTVEDMACTLVEVQRLKIDALNEELRIAHRANTTLGGELLEASEARAAALVSLATQVKRAAALTETCVKQRDTVVQALRSLCAHLANQPITSLTYFGGEAFARSAREANELLTIIDQLQAAAGARPPG